MKAIIGKEQQAWFLLAITCSFCFAVCFTGYAQEVTLRVGDPAPPINVFKWIKGQPVTEFQKGQPYVIEFGATWCGPCARAIPQLSTFARKYRNKAPLVSIFVMERIYALEASGKQAVDMDNPYYLSRVEEYVAKKSNQMKYAVAVDDMHETMSNTWVRPTGSSGVPKIFVVDKEGYIAYAGNVNMQKVAELVDQILDGSYSLEEQVRLNR